MYRVRVWSALFLIVAAPAAAFAHGGVYNGPAGKPSGTPQVPPGTADPPAPQTRWETWWAANKEFYLRLAEEMRKADGPTSRGLSGQKDAGEVSQAELRLKRDAEVRASLVPVFLEALADESFEVRTAAAVALGKTGSPNGSKPLREASMNDKHKDVRDAALIALGLLGRPLDVPFCEARLVDPKENTRHRSFGAFSLGLIGGEESAQALMNFADGKNGNTAVFEHEQPSLISSTFVAMGLTGEVSVLPALRGALANPRFDDNVHAFVVLSLGRLKDRESLARITKMLQGEKDANIRRSAAISLGKIATVADKAALEALLTAAANDSDESVRHFAAISVGGVADDEVKTRLRKLFEEEKGIARPFFALAMALAKDAQAPDILRKALEKESDESIRSSYCIALALLQDAASAPLLQKQLEDRGRVWLQGYAAIGLGMLKHTPSAEMMNARLISENDPRLRANLAVGLGLMHDPRAKEHLLTTLRKPEGTIYERGGAAMGMGVLRMTEAAADITEVFRNKKEQDMVRAFSMVALGLIADPSPVPKLAKFAIDNNYTLAIDPLNEVLTIL